MKPLFFLFPFFLLFLTACGPDAAKFDDYVTAGQEALRSGDWKSACENLDCAARLHPEDGRLQYNLGQAYFLAGRLQPAARAFRNASASLQDENAAVDALLALARVRADQRRWPDAMDALATAQNCASDVRRPDILAAQSGLEFRQNFGEAARRHAAEALDLRPDHPVALYNLGCVQLYCYGEKPAAMRAFARYFKLYSATADEEIKSQFEIHFKHLQGVREGPSVSAQKRIQLSNEAASPVEAMNLALIATQEDPLEGDVWRNYAEKCAAAGKQDEARRALRRFTRLSPKSPLLSAIPADCLASAADRAVANASIALSSAKPNYAAAKNQYLKALEIDPENVNAYIGLECVNNATKDYVGALDAALHANALRPDQPDLLFRIGCYLAGDPNRRDDASAYFRRFLQYGDADSAQAEEAREWLKNL